MNAIRPRETRPNGVRRPARARGFTKARPNGVLRPARARGFTLVELLTVVTIIGILAAIALPSYSAYVTNTRRTDATIFLTEVAGEQQRHFSDRNAYASTMAELGYPDALSGEGYYTVSIARPATTRFTLTATPVAGEVQADDTGCTTFTLNSTGGRGATGTEGRAGCW